jgi:hypothetical protein
VRWSAGCGWLGWRVPPSSSDATGRVDGAGGAPEAAVDGGWGTVAIAGSSGGISMVTMGRVVIGFSSGPRAREYGAGPVAACAVHGVEVAAGRQRRP